MVAVLPLVAVRLLPTFLGSAGFCFLLLRALKFLHLSCNGFVEWLQIDLPRPPLLILDQLSSLSVSLHWHLDSLEHEQEPASSTATVDKYLVQLNGRTIVEASKRETSLVISGLQANMTYAIRVVAVNPQRLLSPSDTVWLHTKPLAGDAPQLGADSHFGTFDILLLDESSPCFVPSLKHVVSNPCADDQLHKPSICELNLLKHSHDHTSKTWRSKCSDTPKGKVFPPDKTYENSNQDIHLVHRNLAKIEHQIEEAIREHKAPLKLVMDELIAIQNSKRELDIERARVRSNIHMYESQKKSSEAQRQLAERKSSEANRDIIQYQKDINSWTKQEEVMEHVLNELDRVIEKSNSVVNSTLENRILQREHLQAETDQLEAEVRRLLQQLKATQDEVSDGKIEPVRIEEKTIHDALESNWARTHEKSFQLLKMYKERYYQVHYEYLQSFDVLSYFRERSRQAARSLGSELFSKTLTNAGRIDQPLQAAQRIGRNSLDARTDYLNTPPSPTHDADYYILQNGSTSERSNPICSPLADFLPKDLFSSEDVDMPQTFKPLHRANLSETTHREEKQPITPGVGTSLAGFTKRPFNHKNATQATTLPKHADLATSTNTPYRKNLLYASTLDSLNLIHEMPQASSKHDNTLLLKQAYNNPKPDFILADSMFKTN